MSGTVGFVAGTVLQKHAPASADLRTGTTIQIGAATIASVPLAAVGGGFALPLTATAIGSACRLAGVTDQEKEWSQGIVDQTKESSLMERYGTLDEQASAICFLASPEASCITGSALPVAGGDLG